MLKLKLTILSLAFIFLPTIAHGATEFISVIDPDNGSGTDYTSLSAWEAANQVDLTAATTLVIAGSLTRGTIADGTPITQTTSGATAVCVHHSATQMLISTLTGTPNATDTWFPTVDGSDVTNAWTPTTAGDSAIAIAKCRSTAGTADATAVTVDGWTTSATNYIKIWTDPSENYRHNGVWDEGKYRLTPSSTVSDAALLIEDEYVRIVGLQIMSANVSTQEAIKTFSTLAGAIYIESNIINQPSSGPTGIYLRDASLVLYINNNIIYNSNNSGAGAIYAYPDNGVDIAYIFSNTVVNSYYGIYRGSFSGTVISKNNIAYNNTTDYSGTFDSSSTNNLSKDATAPPYNTYYTNASVIFADETNRDFHLDSADTGARNRGAILYDSGDDANLNFTTDIDNNSRLDSAGTWDIGADEAITKVYRSVGPSATTALATGVAYGNVEIKPAYVSGSTTNIADYVATFWSDLPTNVGVGDALQYDDDDDGDIDASDSIVFITKRIDASHYSVRTASGTAPAFTLAPDSNWSLFRAYTGLSKAESASTNADENDSIDDDLENFDNWSSGRNIVTSQEQWNITCYANGTTADTVATTIDGWTTSADSFIKVYTPTRSDEVGVSQRHSGVWDTSKYRLEITPTADAMVAVFIRDGAVRLDGLQISQSTSLYANSFGIEIMQSNGMFDISNNIIKATLSSSGYGNGIYVVTSGGSITKIWNNIIYNWDSEGNDYIYGIAANAGGNLYVNNNTAYGNYINYRNFGSTVFVLKNNIAQNSIKSSADADYMGTFDTTSDYNLSSESGATGGAHDKVSKAVTFFDSANNNFHLAPSDTEAKNAGADLSNDAYIPFNTDIDSSCGNLSKSRVTNGGDEQCYTRPRGISWDIGADELIIKIYRSVAPDADGTLEALTTGATNALTIASSTATFATALANNIGVGDAIQYDDDGDSDIDASDSIVFISARTDSTHFTVKTASGAIPTAVSADTDWSLFRAYTSLANAETGTENLAIDADLRNFDSWSGGRDIAASSEQWNIACYANGTTADATRVTVSGWTTAAQNYLKIYTPTLVTEVGTSQRHNGAWNTSKYNFSNDIDSTAVSYVRIDGLQMFMTGDDGGYMVRVINSGPKTEISNNIVRANLTGSQAHIGIMEGYVGITKIY
ncbi:MAG: hypothetical protein M0P97_02090, partial [Candidatus Moranbacteria bacterium]|nr:hypothetical protein [Candidatus Moranbacteria bacterium]